MTKLHLHSHLLPVLVLVLGCLALPATGQSTGDLIISKKTSTGYEKYIPTSFGAGVLDLTAWPTFNQNTTGSAARLTTARTINGVSFDGTANITLSTEVPLTFSTGLTRTTNTITVNTSQNIATLSNLTGNGFVKTTGGTGALSIDTATYLTGNQTITLSGDVTGSGTTAITATLANTAVTPGSYTNSNLTVNSKGQITAISNGSSGGGGGLPSATGKTNWLLTNDGTDPQWTQALTGLTTVAQTGLHTLTVASNTIEPVPRIQLTNTQTAVADTESGLADPRQRAPSIQFTSNGFTGGVSTAKSIQLWSEAQTTYGAKLHIGVGDNEKYLTASTAGVHLFEGAVGLGTKFLRIGDNGEGGLFQISYDGGDTADISGIRLNVVNSDIVFNRAATGGTATFENGLTTGSGDDITGQGSITTNSATEGIGYRTGAGGTVTQTTSRTEPVTFTNPGKICGTITTHTTSLAHATEATFTVNNQAVDIGDVVVLSIRSGAVATPMAWVSSVTADSFNITISNLHASLAETGAIVINFAIIKAVTN